jgi:hypothetical protein
MTRELALAIMIALGVLLLLGMTLSIVRRRATGRLIGPFPLPSEVPGDTTASFPVLHVATTLARKPMERVWASPLAYRSKTLLGVRSGGVVLSLTGEGEMGLPAQSIAGCGRGSWTIDKAVDPEGLIVITWLHDGVEYDSYFRSVDQPAEDVLDAIDAITPPTTTKGSH